LIWQESAPALCTGTSNGKTATRSYAVAKRDLHVGTDGRSAPAKIRTAGSSAGGRSQKADGKPV